MAGQGVSFESNVFINCPFDATYLPLLRPLLFTVDDDLNMMPVPEYLDFIQRWVADRK